ncbi:MAG: divergent PAP2 family protein [Candidatus Eisenbacteria bacterium]
MWTGRWGDRGRGENLFAVSCTCQESQRDFSGRRTLTTLSDVATIAPARARRCPFGGLLTTDGREGRTEPFWIAALTGLAVQGFKGFSTWARTGRLNLRRFVETGGMPSSHSASVAALSMAIGLQEGFTSALFGVTLYFSLIVMYDAAGLRRAAGKQAMVLNRLIETHFRSPHDDTQKLMELLGHTPFEVLVGGLLGTGVALLWNRVHPL